MRVSHMGGRGNSCYCKSVEGGKSSICTEGGLALAEAWGLNGQHGTRMSGFKNPKKEAGGSDEGKGKYCPRRGLAEELTTNPNSIERCPREK